MVHCTTTSSLGALATKILCGLVITYGHDMEFTLLETSMASRGRLNLALLLLGRLRILPPYASDLSDRERMRNLLPNNGAASNLEFSQLLINRSASSGFQPVTSPLLLTPVVRSNCAPRFISLF